MFANMLINGWQLSPIYHWATGNLASATYGSDVALTGAGSQRAQQVLGNVYDNNGPLDYLNINAFLQPAAAPAGVYASTRPFTISNPNVWNIDLSLSRDFRFHEHDTITFRAEAFNATNSVVLGGVTTGVTSTSFGRLVPIAQSSAPGNSSTARIMQFAIKFAF